MQRRFLMEVDAVRAYFEALASEGRAPRLPDAVGTVRFDIDGAGSWAVRVEHGDLTVTNRPSGPSTCRLHMAASDFLRLARGDEGENLVTALLRGIIRAEGDFAFLSKLQAILPMPDAWRQRS